MRAATCLALTLLTVPAFASEQDRVGAPYFHVNSDDPNTDRLPLKSTKADVEIAGTIAHVRVTQTYANEGSKPLEAIYVFPGSTRSAVFGMRMTIGERTIEAKIQKKEEARRLYEAAKSQGKSASLLEQKRPNVFQMNVANIMPGDVIKVVLDYTELLVPEEGVYELVYPTVVGPRYTGESSKAESWTENPHLPAGKASTYDWDMSVRVRAGMDIRGVRSPSHTIAPSFMSPTSVAVELDDPKGGNRDFVLRYRLAGDRIETGVLTFEDEQEKFFLLMMEPPKRVQPSIIPPREYVFVVDVSGSMRGFPLDTSKQVMRGLLKGMRSEDRFNLMFFAGSSWTLAKDSLRATPENVAKAMSALGRQRGGGGTRLNDAMRRTLAMPRAENMSTSIVVITDGYVSVERSTFEIIRDNLGEANLFAFGIGSSVNRHLIEGMARAGMGQPFVVLNAEQASREAKRFKTYIESPVLTNVKLAYDGFDAYDVEPKALPDLFAARPIVAFGKYRGAASGSIQVTGFTGASTFSRAVSVSGPASKQSNQALRYLWARHRIKRLADIGKYDRTGEIKEQVTQLGLQYNLMTEHTSFVAVDNMVRNTDGNTTTVKQPLPMPQGVPNSAVGRSRMMMKKSMGYRTRGGGRGIGYAGSGSGGGGVATKGYGAAAAEDAAPMAPPPMRPALSMGGERKNKDGKAKVKGEAIIAGSMDKSSIQRVFRRHQRQFRRLYEQTLKSNPSLKGKLVLKLVIGANGRVKSAKVTKSTLGDTDFERKLLALVKRWRFPKPAGGGEVVVSYSLAFTQ